MQQITVGDVVVRRSHQFDIYFRVMSIEDEVASLQGLFYRLSADAPVSDLVLVSPSKVKEMMKKNYFAAQGDNKSPESEQP